VERRAAQNTEVLTYDFRERCVLLLARSQVQTLAAIMLVVIFWSAAVCVDVNFSTVEGASTRAHLWDVISWDVRFSKGLENLGGIVICGREIKWRHSA